MAVRPRAWATDRPIVVGAGVGYSYLRREGISRLAQYSHGLEERIDLLQRVRRTEERERTEGSLRWRRRHRRPTAECAVGAKPGGFAGSTPGLLEMCL